MTNPNFLILTILYHNELNMLFLPKIYFTCLSEIPKLTPVLRNDDDIPCFEHLHLGTFA